MIIANTSIKARMVSGAMQPGVFPICNINDETNDTFTFEVLPTKMVKSFHFNPGQFNMLYVFGIGEIPVSICGDPGDTGRMKHTIRMVGAVSKAMRKLKNGDMIGVRGPFGSAWPVKQSEGKDIILVAGGIGLAPLMPVLHMLLANRGRYGNIALLYGTRSSGDMLFTETLKLWHARFDMQLHVTVDKAEHHWPGNVGVVTKLIKKLSFDPLKAVAMICGPEIMMRFTGIELENHGISREQVYLSMERNMKCATGFCGHCQLGPKFICTDGPVFSYNEMHSFLTKREI